jgi:hypothetical protein
MSDAVVGEREAGQPQRISDQWLTATVVAGLVAAVLVFVVVGTDTDLSVTDRQGGVEENAIPVSTTVAATPAQLSALATSAGYPVFWEGVRPRRALEVTRLPDGRVFIRYLPGDAQPGAATLDYGFIATYPTTLGLRAVRKSARSKGAIARELPGGGLAVATRPGREIVPPNTDLPVRPVFFAYPGGSSLGEIYEPGGVDEAMHKLASGRVAPVS